MITLRKDFNEEQKKLAKRLLDELYQPADELRDYCDSGVFGLKEDENGTSILFEFKYEYDKEFDRHTIVVQGF